MTPNEKAVELFEKFMKPIDGLHKYPMCHDTAKQCAIIAVNEIIKAIDWHYYETPNNEIEYWQQVKYEIERI